MKEKFKKAFELWLDGNAEKEGSMYEAADQFGLFGHFIHGCVIGFRIGITVLGALYWLTAVIARIKGKDLEVKMVDKPKK